MTTEARPYGPVGEEIQTATAAHLPNSVFKLADGRAALNNNMRTLAVGEQFTAVTAGLFYFQTASATTFAYGDDVAWDASANLAIAAASMGVGDFLIGKCRKACASGQTEVVVDLNARSVDPLPACMQGKTFETVSADKTLDAQDVGKVIDVDTAGKTITLPATAAGLEFVVRCGATDGTVGLAISPNAADKIMGADVAGADDKDYLLAAATAMEGDYIQLVADGSAGWYVRAIEGTWTQEG